MDALIVAAQAEIQQIGDFQNQRLQKAPDFIVSCKAPIRTLAADHENAIDQYHLDVSDITMAARLFDCFIGEHGGANGGDLERLLAQPITAFGDKLSRRHEAFRSKVDELCAREDVSDSSVEEAQKEFSAELDKASAKLDEIRANEQQRSRERFRADAQWDLTDPVPAAE